MTKKPDVKLYQEDEPQGESNRAAIARRYPALIQGGVLFVDGTFRAGHLEQVLHEYITNQVYCERVRADELAYIREAMPEVLE